MPKSKKFNNRQITGNVGLYYVCYRLASIGWNVMPTSRNAKGVDVLAYDETSSRTIKIQVKTCTNREAISFGKEPKYPSDFYIIVTNAYLTPTTFILTPSDINPLLSLHKEVNWLEIKSYAIDNFRDDWKRIGCGWGKDTECNIDESFGFIETPLSKTSN